MKRLDERANGLRWRLRATRRLWSAGAEPETPFLSPEPLEDGVGGQIDHPAAGEEIEGEILTVSGWAAFEAGPTARVEIWLGERSLGRARLGVPRPDVEEISDLSHTAAAVCGFELTADLGEALAEGEEGETRLRMVATAIDGRSFEGEPVPVTIAPPPPARRRRAPRRRRCDREPPTAARVGGCWSSPTSSTSAAPSST